MRIAIIQFPGSNCESESLYAVREAGMEVVEFLWNRSYDDLKNFDGYFIVGGFSYEDRSRSGVIASLDPIMQRLRVETEQGKPLLGICNGAQILVETGLVPGLKDNQVGMALAVNKRIKNGKILGTGFYNTWANVQLSAPSQTCAFTRHLRPGEFIRIPVAHGEGRFVITEKLLEEMKVKNLTVFRYCDEHGNISEEFPTNPNGAVYNLAAVCNNAGNIMAMMPHPERTNNGQPIFTSMREYIEEKKTIVIPNEREESLAINELTYQPPKIELQALPKTENAAELLVDLIITDNEAATVQNTLQQLGLLANLKRLTHWEITFEDNADKEKILSEIIKSGELFNSNKEKLVTSATSPDPSLESRGGPPFPLSKGEYKGVCRRLLVRYRDDFVGQSKTDLLKHRFGLSGLKNIKKGTLWEITAKDGNLEDIQEGVLNTRILFNQFSQECFIL
ncbi:MAG: phosphoribosylformylglycinamidine synthase I [Patescibacteria group bacterium]